MSAPSAAAPTPAPFRPAAIGWRILGDRVFQVLCYLAALAVPAVVALMLVFLVMGALPSLLRFGASMLSGMTWDKDAHLFGALPFIFGTVVTSAIAMLFAVPLGVGAAAFLSEIAPGWLRRLASFLIELLAAIPSVVYGFWGLFFLNPRVEWLLRSMGVPDSTGRSLFTAGLLLAIMIVPYITAITFDVCQAVPTAQRQGSLALGATRWQTIWSVVLPYARPGIMGACFLALGRALGETMAVAMVMGNNPRIGSIFSTGATIPTLLAFELPGAQGDALWNSALIQLALILFLVTVVVNSLARLLIWNTATGGGRPGWFRRAFGALGRLAVGSRPAAAAAAAEGAPEAAAGPPPTPAPSQPTRAPELVSARKHPMAAVMNSLMTGVMIACLLVILVPLFHILSYVVLEGFGNLNLAFFTNLPNDDTPGLGHALIGTLVMVGLATVGAVPVGILAALFLTEYKTSRLAPVVRFVGELLGGVPSVVIGIFVYSLAVMTAPDEKHIFSAWAGAFALGVMMLPIVMRASEESLKLVPSSLRNASYALGASHSQTVGRVILPAALSAIITGVFLAVARIIGETAPLLFTAYNSNYWMKSLDKRTPFLTYYIYNYGTSDSPSEQRLAWAAAVVLLLFVMLLNIGIRVLAGRRAVSAARAD
jgi:phosphate transport system permease protein